MTNIKFDAVLGRAREQDEQVLEVVGGGSTVTTGGSFAPAALIYAYQDYEKTATYVYAGYLASSGDWYIYRRTISTNVRLYATGGSGYAAAWTNRASETYT